MGRVRAGRDHAAGTLSTADSSTHSLTPEAPRWLPRFGTRASRARARSHELGVRGRQVRRPAQDPPDDPAGLFPLE